MNDLLRSQIIVENVTSSIQQILNLVHHIRFHLILLMNL